MARQAASTASLAGRTNLRMIVGIGVLCFVGAAWAFTSVAPEPYMVVAYCLSPGVLLDRQDEIFHVPMTQAYCRADYGRWDPKVTTPPGLYLFAAAYARVVSVILHPVHKFLSGGLLRDNGGAAAAAEAYGAGGQEEVGGGGYGGVGKLF